MEDIYFIAECGINHNGNLKRACESIFQAKQCGFNAVKFQLYNADRLTGDQKTRDLLKAGQFDPEWLPEIRKFCDEMKIGLGITPFYPEAVEIIKPYVDWIKIGSSELHYADLLYEATASQLPIIASAGFISSPIGSVHVKNLTALLYCIPEYPCEIKDLDMNWIKSAKKNNDFAIGWSDHSHNQSVIWASLIAGAEYIEMHFDIDGGGLEYNMGHVWLPDECYELISYIREAEMCFVPSDYIPDYSKRTNQGGRRG